MAVKTCLMIGGSGMAGHWIRLWTENFSDRVKLIGLVDVNKEVLERQGEALGLSSIQRFTDFHEACARVKADFCGIAIPPQFHSPAAIAAMENGMPVICEKPIADTLQAAKAVVRTAQRTGLPCAIIQNYRYAPNKQELVRILTSGRLGRLGHIVARYACDYRRYGSWGKTWRHDMDFALLFEAAVHHFDMLRFLSGGDCETLFGFGWNPEGSSFLHSSSGFYLMRMTNGVHACYEGNSSAAGLTNCWHRESYRAEFEAGTVEIADGNRMTIHRVKPEPNFDRLNHQNAGASGRPRFLFKRFRREKGLERPESYEAPAMPRVGHAYLFDEFLNWLDGGPPSATRIEDNIKSFAMVIAAMETTVDGQPKTVDL